MDLNFLATPQLGVQLPDPLVQLQKLYTLQGMQTRNQESSLTLAETQRTQAAHRAAEKGLYLVQTGTPWDQAIRQVGSESPDGAALLVDLKTKLDTAAANTAKASAGATKDLAQGAKFQDDIRDRKYQMAVGTANFIAQKQKPTIEDAQALATKMLDAGMSRDDVTKMPDVTQDPEAFKEFARGIAAGGIKPRDAAEIYKISKEVPANVALKEAQTKEAGVRTEYIPYNAQTQRGNMLSGQSNAQTARNNLLLNMSKEDPLGLLGLNAGGAKMDLNYGPGGTGGPMPGSAPQPAAASGGRVTGKFNFENASPEEVQAAIRAATAGGAGPAPTAAPSALAQAVQPNDPTNPATPAFDDAARAALRTAIQNGVKGPELLNLLPRQLKDQVSSIIEGRYTTPAGFMAKAGTFQQLLQLAQMVDPTLDATVFNARQKLRSDATAGKLATSNNAINTVIQHFGVLDKAIDALGNNDIPLANSFINAAARFTGNTDRMAKLSNFDSAKRAVAEELTRAYRQVGGTLEEVKGWQQEFDAANSPAAMHAAVDTLVDLLKGKIEANQEQWNTGMGPIAKDVNRPVFVSPKSQEFIDAVAKRKSGLADMSPAAAPAAVRQSDKLPNPKSLREGSEVDTPDGKTLVVRNGQYVVKGP